MRSELRKLGNKSRHRFQGTVMRFGMATNPFNPYNHIEETILLVDVFLLDDKGNPKELVTDHLWFKRNLQFKRIDANIEDVIQFDARVDNYYKRNHDSYDYELIEDYRLVRPTKVVNISRPNVKIDVPTIKEQKDAMRKDWEDKKKLKEIEEKTRLASDAQVNYIRAISCFLKIGDPTKKPLLFKDAKEWLNNIFSEHPNLQDDMRNMKAKEQVEKTKKRNAHIYEEIKSKLKTIEDIAAEYQLAVSTVKGIYRQQDKLSKDED